MIMIDKTKAAIIGERDVIIEEVAFLIDKLCSEADGMQGETYDSIREILVREADKLKEERKHGRTKSHPSHPTKSNEFSDEKKAKESKESKKKTPAELALEQALKDIEKLKKKGKKKKKNKGKKDTE